MSDCGDVWYESDARFPPPKIVGRLVPIERAEKAEAAIQRVLELAEFWKAQVADSPSGASWVYMSAASRLLLDALDGDSDE